MHETLDEHEIPVRLRPSDAVAVSAGPIGPKAGYSTLVKYPGQPAPLPTK